MNTGFKTGLCALCGIVLFAPVALAEWSYGAGAGPNAFIQTDKMTLELHCDRMRFSPAGYEDAQNIEAKQGLSIRFMKNGATETGAFQAGSANATIRIVDNYPVEIVFKNHADYNFVLDQIGKNAVLNLAMIDQDVSYGIFDLKGSGAAIKSLRKACSGASASAPAKPVASTPPAPEAPEGVVYCGGGAIKRMIEYVILPRPDGEWGARVTVNGQTIRAMTAYSYFGHSPAPKGFVVALLGEDRSEFLVFRDGHKDWLEFGDHTYHKCN